MEYVEYITFHSCKYFTSTYTLRIIPTRLSSLQLPFVLKWVLCIVMNFELRNLSIAKIIDDFLITATNINKLLH